MSIPLIILAGGATREERLPDTEDAHRIYGPKGMRVRLGDRPLIDVVVERFHGSGAFDPVFIAGPAESYGQTRGPATVIDTDAHFGGNIQASLEWVVERHSPEAVAFAACDVIPDPDELRRIVDDYLEHAPLDFWFPQIRAPEDRARLGAAAGKRQYRIVPESETEAVRLLPGHLVIIDPNALRLAFIYQALELAYRSRTRPLFSRSVYMTNRVLLWLLGTDLSLVFRLRPPLLTLGVLYNAIRLGFIVGSGSAAQADIEFRLRRLFVRRTHRKRHADRKGRIPLLHGLSMAKDIDTDREAAERSLEF